MAKWEEFYIIQKDSGQTLFHKSFSKKNYDADLFAGLFTAILQFAKAYSKSSIGDFEMKKKVILIGQSDQYPLIFVYIVDKSQIKKKKKVKKMIKIIIKDFESEYDINSIRKWNGNINMFKPFGQKVDEVLHPWKTFESLGF